MSATLGSEQAFPDEFVDYRLCEKFGWTPDQIDAMDADRVALFVAFMNAEAKASALRSQKAKFYQKGA